MQGVAPEDRRRTQVRLAQREYRQREKTAIATLEIRVKQLQSLAADMNCAFFRFKDDAISSHSFAARPELERALQTTASTITNLYQSAAAAPNTDSEQGETGLPSPPSPPDAEQTSSAEVTTTTTQDDAQETIQPTSPPDAIHPSSELPFGYTLTFDDDDDDASEESSIVSTTSNTPSPTATPTIQPPYTYSFHEPSFGARLERAALERAAHVLSAIPVVRPVEFQRLFRICRHFTDRSTLLALFTAILRAPAIRPFSALTLHLGGAGLHFASSSSSSSSSVNSVDVDVVDGDGRGEVPAAQPLVPRTAADNVRAARARLRALGLRSTPALEADVALYAGVWLDSRDVERYLAGALGVRIGPRASVVEVESAVLDRVVGVGGVGSSSRRQRQQQQQQQRAGEEDEMTTMQGLLDGDCEIATHSFRGGVAGVEAGVEVQLADELGEDEWERFCASSTPWLLDGGAAAVASPATTLGGGSGRVAVDLDRFIKGLIRRAGCVGSGPGFRLEDVHSALRGAVIGL